MDFGAWVRDRRKRKGLDLPLLAQRAGVDRGTISRIENGQTRPTVRTVVQICEALQASRAEVIQEFGGEAGTLYCPLDWPPTGLLPALTIGDVATFVDFYDQDPQGGYSLLAELLSQVGTLQTERADDLEEPSALPTEAKRFLPEDIPRLLADSSFYQIDLQYPMNIKANLIRHICRSGGLLMQRDVGAFIRAVREERGWSLRQLGQRAQLTYSGLSRLETGQKVQTKLEEVLRLDEQLEERGNILDMHWIAYKSEVEIDNRLAGNRPRSDGKLVSILILTCRWLQHLLGSDDTTWIENIRRLLSAV